MLTHAMLAELHRCNRNIRTCRRTHSLLKIGLGILAGLLKIGLGILAGLALFIGLLNPLLNKHARNIYIQRIITKIKVQVARIPSCSR